MNDFDEQQRIMSPNSVKRLNDQVYGFKKHKKDSEVDIPSLAGFYPFLAKILMQQKSQDIMLNIPETLIIHNEDLLRGSR